MKIKVGLGIISILISTMIYSGDKMVMGNMTQNGLYSEGQENFLTGKLYTFEEDDCYNLDLIQDIEEDVNRVIVDGDIDLVSEDNGIPSFSVSSGNLRILLSIEI